MTMQDDLHRETKVMPVKEHCALLSMQYLLMSQAPQHPNHGLMDTSERDMRLLLAMEYKEEVDYQPPSIAEEEERKLGRETRKK